MKLIHRATIAKEISEMCGAEIRCIKHDEGREVTTSRIEEVIRMNAIVWLRDNHIRFLGIREPGEAKGDDATEKKSVGQGSR